ncbi:MAG: transglycosylase SLT domain-containing protein [Halieaceae bacterium]|nr:transglycosylase SLT domain-containing protein [Halieaceae bacterium]
MGFRARLVLFFGLLGGGAGTAWAIATEADLARERIRYDDAVQAIDRGNWTEYQRLRPDLEDYPLAIYLDYFELSRQPGKVRPAQARRFLERTADSPLANRFLATYLRQAGKDGRWDDFLEVMSTEPNSIDLKCYYFRARLAAGDSAAAWAGAQRLWDHGESRPTECDPLFSAWRKSGGLNDAVVWSRQLKAFAARQGSLLQYAARQGSAALAPWSEKLATAYRQPEKLRQLALPADQTYSADIATSGLVLLARYNPVRALQFWQQYRDELAFTSAQQREVEYAIALQTLFAQSEENQAWLAEALARLQDDKLVEIRLRWALAEQDWPGVTRFLPLLSEERRGADVWRYWQAVALQQAGDAAAANAGLQSLAAERSYYGFLAADKLAIPYAFNHQTPPLDLEAAAALQQLPGVRRVGELNFHEQYNLAHAEWYQLLQGSDDATRSQQLAQVASREGWHRMAIDAVTRARAWDALELRFPTAYRDVFERYAAVQQVPSTELMAIARRESAFYPQARSPVGARGLMQIMPATGRQVASSLGQGHSGTDLYQVDHNVLLGSAYYRQLLDRFEGNRIFALTAYNAGPHRVERWRHSAGEAVPVDIWVETIPYRETREYVQAVLAYNVVFEYLMGDTPSLLSEEERGARY